MRPLVTSLGRKTFCGGTGAPCFPGGRTGGQIDLLSRFPAKATGATQQHQQKLAKNGQNDHHHPWSGTPSSRPQINRIAVLRSQTCDHTFSPAPLRASKLRECSASDGEWHGVGKLCSRSFPTAILCERSLNWNSTVRVENACHKIGFSPTQLLSSQQKIQGGC